MEKVEEDVRDVSWACIGLVAACAFRLGIFDVLRWDERQQSPTWGKKTNKNALCCCPFLGFGRFSFSMFALHKKGLDKQIPKLYHSLS